MTVDETIDGKTDASTPDFTECFNNSLRFMILSFPGLPELFPGSCLVRPQYPENTTPQMGEKNIVPVKPGIMSECGIPLPSPFELVAPG